jgi:predicted TIM-barrel enzyme
VLPLSAGGAGQIVGPDGKVFIPRGVNVLEGAEVSASTLQAMMSGINFVRYAVYESSTRSDCLVCELADPSRDCG